MIDHRQHKPEERVYTQVDMATARAEGYAAGVKDVLALQKYVVDNLEGDTEKTGWVLASDIRALLSQPIAPLAGPIYPFGGIHPREFDPDPSAHGCGPDTQK
jgi:hypothetical protein